MLFAELLLLLVVFFCIFFSALTWKKAFQKTTELICGCQYELKKSKQVITCFESIQTRQYTNIFLAQ